MPPHQPYPDMVCIITLPLRFTLDSVGQHLITTGAPPSFPAATITLFIVFPVQTQISGTSEAGCLSNTYAHVLWSRIGRLVTVGTLWALLWRTLWARDTERRDGREEKRGQEWEQEQGERQKQDWMTAWWGWKIRIEDRWVLPRFIYHRLQVLFHGEVEMWFLLPGTTDN